MYYQKQKEVINNYRNLERKSLLIVSLFLSFLFFVMYKNISRDFDSIENGYGNGTVINLDKNLNTKQLSALLIANNYFIDSRDADFFSFVVKSKLQQTVLQNLGSLNKGFFLISPNLADSLGGDMFRKRVQNAYQSLHYDSVIEKKYLYSLPSRQINLNQNGPTITVEVEDEDDIKKEGVVVQLQQYFQKTDSTANGEELSDSSDEEKIDTTQYFATTDKYGIAVFAGLKPGGFYSVLPVKKGFNYGPPLGTTNGPLAKNLTCFFTEKQQLIQLLSSLTYKQIKEDRVFTVRSPKEFKTNILPYLIGLLLAWWLVHFWLVARSKRTDELVLPIIMILTGICVIVMYAIQDPLNDMNKGNEMARSVIIGLGALLVFSEFNIVRIYNGKWFNLLNALLPRIFKPGSLYFIFASIFLIVLLIYGKGPEGSGVKINLKLAGLTFQPSEIIKYLIIIFLAAYFSRNAELLKDIPNMWIRFKKSLFILLGIGALLFLYLMLGDMGPALVLCGTFIILYAVARGDFLQLGIGVLSYSLLMVVTAKWFDAGTVALVIMTLLWLLIWLFIGFMKKTVYESALFLVIVIAAFIFGKDVPHVGKRLAERNEMYNNLWNNQTFGGNQVAHGIWSISSGGFTGQGIGEGNSKVMPANLTDMIFTSIGEELGWIGLLLIILCFAILLHRSLLLARKAAHPFAFYLASGVAIVTGLQFFIIAAGSLGIIPLTGITLPFLSLGGVSMITNIAAFGIVLSISQISGSDRQAKAIQRSYDNTLVLGSISFILGSFLLLGYLFYYQVIAANEVMVKPAYTVNRNGEIISTYNPRINLLMKKLKSGNILDRNGLLLATDERDLVMAQQNTFINSGVPDSLLYDLKVKRLKRFYPFGQYMFFWLGDYNSALPLGNDEKAKGFFAENRYLAELRGFNNQPDNEYSVELESAKYRENPFLPEEQRTFTFTPYDYSALIPLLKAGINSNEVKNFNLVKRDIKLTIDAKLQTVLQKDIAVNLSAKNNLNKCRASVVIINAANGEVLTSALYPLPETDIIKQLYELPPTEQNRTINRITINNRVFTEADLGITFGTAPGSTAKLMSALAGLNKSGPVAAKQVYQVTADERIHEDDKASEPIGNIDMQTAIVKSSNIYFIKMINELELDDQLADIYQAVGISIDNAGSYNFFNTRSLEDIKKIKNHWKSEIFNVRRGNYTNELYKNKPRIRLRSEFSNLAWGQGKMTATPIAIARITGVMANKGKMQASKFVLSSTVQDQLPLLNAIEVSPESNADILKNFMQLQSEALSKEVKVTLYGKTGSPERIVPTNKKITDAWYTFFFYSEKMNKEPIAVCIRIERIGGSGSAKKLAIDVVIPALKTLGYIK